MSEYILHTAQEENIVLPGHAAERLIRSGNGDAALLYIAFIRSRTAPDTAALCAQLGWSRLKFDTAAQALEQLGLLSRPAESHSPAAPPTAPERERAEYTNADLLGALERQEFAALSRAVDHALGKRLTTPDQKILLGLYDDLGLSADVIYLLVNFCIERSAARYGAGRRPTMRQIEQEGYAWARMELTDQDRASAYIKKYHRSREALPRMMQLLGLGDRKLSASEERYLTAWLDMGFEDAAIELAYDKTMLKCKELKWPYMNKILSAWHEKRLHTVQAIEEGDRPAAAGKPQPVSTSPDDAELKRMEAILRRMKSNDPGKGE